MEAKNWKIHIMIWMKSDVIVFLAKIAKIYNNNKLF